MQISDRVRLLCLVAYLAGAYLLNVWFTGQWSLIGGGKGLWFLTVSAYLTLALLSSRYFQKPDDSLATALAASLLLWSTELSAVQTLQAELTAFRSISVVFTLLVLLIAVVAVAARRGPPAQNPTTARVAYRLSQSFGGPALLLTPPVLLSSVAFYAGESEKMLIQMSVWVLLVTAQPLESLAQALSTILTAQREASAGSIGQIVRIDSPGIVRVAMSDDAAWDKSGVVLARTADGKGRWMLPLFVQVQDGALVGTALSIRDAEVDDSHRHGLVYGASDPPDRGEEIKRITGTELEAELVGFVVEESRIGTIRFEVAEETSLKEGSIVFSRQGEDTVFYQVLDARTAEESFERNPRGTHIVTARQLGVPKKNRGFCKHPWLPRMNAPVFLALALTDLVEERDESTESQFALGHVPGTNIPVLADYRQLHQFHAAILGATGTGKTELAFDVIRQAHARGVKVICVDFTGEYLPRLQNLNPSELGLNSERSEALNRAVEEIEFGQYKSEAEKEALAELMTELRPEVEAEVTSHLSRDGGAVAVLELPEMTNTRSSLRATELYLATVFSWAQAHRQARQILVVLEEAHTIVPEMNIFGYDKGETQTVLARMNQIALQGRKYGVGLLLVSQRTALVSKTVLSQCNTVITFSLVDETSLNYLANVFGRDHVDTVPSLPSLHAVAHGKGILSDNPILVQIPFDERKKAASRALAFQETDEVDEGARPEAAGSP